LNLTTLAGSSVALSGISQAGFFADEGVYGFDVRKRGRPLHRRFGVLRSRTRQAGPCVVFRCRRLMGRRRPGQPHPNRRQGRDGHSSDWSGEMSHASSPYGSAVIFCLMPTPGAKARFGDAAAHSRNWVGRSLKNRICPRPTGPDGAVMACHSTSSFRSTCSAASIYRSPPETPGVADRPTFLAGELLLDGESFSQRDGHELPDNTVADPKTIEPWLFRQNDVVLGRILQDRRPTSAESAQIPPAAILIAIG